MAAARRNPERNSSSLDKGSEKMISREKGQMQTVPVRSLNFQSLVVQVQRAVRY